jgi:hypothetical protein
MGDNEHGWLRARSERLAALLAHNSASRAVAEATGLSLVWAGPDRAGPSAGQIRLLFADRDLTDSQVSAMVRTL